VVRLLILTVAVIAAVAASWLSFVVTSQGPETTIRAGADPVATVEILVAAAPLDKGARLDKTTMRWHPWPQSAVSEGLVTRAQSADAIGTYEGKVARFAIAQGEPIRVDLLADPGAGFLSALLPPGKRAVAIRISAESTAGGFILPDDQVDVIHTRTNVDPTFEGKRSHTILRSVKVLAVDQSSDSQSRTGSGATVGKTATLQLSPAQAELITSAQATGYLSLTLRSATDQGEDASTVSVSYEAPDAEPAGPKKRTVQIYSGGQLSTIETTDPVRSTKPPKAEPRPRTAPRAPSDDTFAQGSGRRPEVIL